MTIDDRQAARERFRTLLVNETHCAVQAGADGTGWPCGTCLMDWLSHIGLDDTKPEYREHNPEHERHNEVWRAILQIRDAELAASPG